MLTWGQFFCLSILKSSFVRRGMHGLLDESTFCQLKHTLCIEDSELEHIWYRSIKADVLIAGLERKVSSW